MRSYNISATLEYQIDLDVYADENTINNNEELKAVINDMLASDIDDINFNELTITIDEVEDNTWEDEDIKADTERDRLDNN